MPSDSVLDVLLLLLALAGLSILDAVEFSQALPQPPEERLAENMCNSLAFKASTIARFNSQGSNLNRMNRTKSLHELWFGAPVRLDFSCLLPVLVQKGCLN